MQDIIPIHGRNGQPAEPRERKKKRGRLDTAEPTAIPKPTPATPPSVRWVATAGVALTAILSASLNGYCYSTHAPAPWAGWALGIAVPALILILGRVAGGAWKQGQRLVMGIATGSGLSLLALSVTHCATSISAVTGSSLGLAVPLAIAIDCGLVSCELALIAEE